MNEEFDYCGELRAMLGGVDNVHGVVANAFFSRNNGFIKPIIPYGFTASDRYPKDVKLLKEYLNKDSIFKLDFTIRTYSKNLVYVHVFTLLGTVSSIRIKDEEGKEYSKDYYFVMVVSKNGLATMMSAMAPVNSDNLSFVDLPMCFIEFNYFSKFRIKDNVFGEYLTDKPSEGEEEFLRVLDLETGEKVIKNYYYKKGMKNRLHGDIENLSEDLFKQRSKVLDKEPGLLLHISKERIYDSIISNGAKKYYETLDRFLGKYFTEYNYLMELAKVKGTDKNDDVISIKNSNIINLKTEFLDNMLGVSCPGNEYVNGTNGDVTIFPYIYESAIDIKTMKDFRDSYGDIGTSAISSNKNHITVRDFKELYRDTKLINVVRYTTNITMFRRFVSRGENSLIENITLSLNDHSTIMKDLNSKHYYNSLKKMMAVISSDKIKFESLFKSYYQIILQSDRVCYKYTTEASNKLIGGLTRTALNLYSCMRILELTNAFLNSCNSKRDIEPHEYKYLFKEDLLRGAFIRYENAKKAFNNVLISILRFKCFDIIDSVREQIKSGFITYRDVKPGISYERLERSNADLFDKDLLNYFEPKHFKLVDRKKTPTSKKTVGRGMKSPDVKTDIMDFVPDQELPGFLKEAIISWNSKK